LLSAVVVQVERVPVAVEVQVVTNMLRRNQSCQTLHTQ
jgi:hypothetical protein